MVDADSKGFFDHLDHGLLGAMLGERVSDRRVMDLITGWLGAGVLAGSSCCTRCRHPAGRGRIALLANVYLDCLDQAWPADDRRLGELTR